jgi:hypothetical protein
MNNKYKIVLILFIYNIVLLLVYSRGGVSMARVDRILTARPKNLNI